MTADVNPVELKIALATRGARIDARLRPHVDAAPDFTPRGLQLVLPDDVRVLVPIDDATSPDAPYAVVAEAERTFVVGDGALHVEVQPAAVPRFYGRRTAEPGRCGRSAPCRDAPAREPERHVRVHAQRALQRCREGARPTGERERAASIADVIEVVRAAFEEGAADFVFFNSSVYDAEDGGIGFLTPYIEGVRKHFDTFVALQVHPPRSDRWIDRTYAMGVDALSYNLELFDPDALGRHCIGRVRYIGRERYLEALAYAAGVFPSGTV